MNRRTFLLMQWRSNRGWSTVIVNSFQRTVSQHNPESHRSITDISQHQISVNNISQHQISVNTRYRSTTGAGQHQTSVNTRHFSAPDTGPRQASSVETWRTAVSCCSCDFDTQIKEREKGLWRKESGYRVKCSCFPGLVGVQIKVML